MLLYALMKYIPLTVISVTLLTTAFISYSMSGAFNAFDLWIYAPFIISALLSALYLSRRIKSHILGISGAITCCIVLFPYFSAYNYKGADGQVGLIFAVIPVYQYIGIFLFGLLAYLTKHITSR